MRRCGLGYVVEGKAKIVRRSIVIMKNEVRRSWCRSALSAKLVADAVLAGIRVSVENNRYNRTMADLRRFTAIIEREDDGYVSLCPEYDVASQGRTIAEARANLIEALTLFFESADAAEVEASLATGRLHYAG